MDLKKSMLILILAIFFISIAGVCASDANDTAVASEDANQIEVSSNDVIIEDSLKTSEENATLAQTNDDDTLSAESDSQTLSEGEGTYYDLINEIGEGGDKNLTKSYYSYNGGDTIEITSSGVINGNGAVIDMAGSNIRAFYVTASGVTIKDLTIKNANNTAGSGGAIYFSSSGAVENCNFINNTAEDNGGAINFAESGIVTNCSFTDNRANNYGGAINTNSATLTNCNFTNNKATTYNGGAINGKSKAINCTFKENRAGNDGGAISQGSAVNCTFSGNRASSGGAMCGRSCSAVNCTFSGNTAFWGGAISEGSAVNCTFSGNAAYIQGGAISDGFIMNCIGQNDYYFAEDLLLHWDANDFTTRYGSGERLPIQLKNQANRLIDFINYDVIIYKDGINVKTYHCLSNEGPSIDLEVGIYTAKLTVTYPGIDQPEAKSITLTVNDAAFTELNKTINDNTDDTITLDNDYIFNSTFDSAFSDGIVINRQVTINGNGYTIDAQGKARVFDVQADNVTIKNLTIKNAYHAGDGGAIYFSSSGTVENCNFINNTADDTGRIMDGAGGAIYFSVSGTVENCNFTNNAVSGYAGAIYGGSAVNCIFTGNTASVRGGAMYGGSAVNCIFTGNSARYGGAMYYGSAVNCTFISNSAGDDGGAMHYGSAVLCILKTSSDTLFYTDIPNTFTVSKSVFRFDLGDRLLFNLTYDNKNYDGYNTTITLTKDGNLVGVYYALSGSDEGWFMNLDQGRYSAVLSLEQYEAIPITVDIFVGIDAITYSVLSNEIASGGDYIKLMFSEYTYDYGSTIEINRPNTVIDGNGAVIDMAGSNIRALTVSASNVTIKNLTIKNANFDGDGGAIYFDTQGTVENCKFTDNQALGGGAVYFSSSGSAINCKFTDNQAQGGGAVYFSSSGSAINCNFANNTASNGGAICILASCTVMNCNFTNNTASNGGAIYSCLRKSAATIIITNNTFTDNSAQNNGGAIYNYLWMIEGTTTIKDNTFTGNAAKDGTAIYTECGYEDLQRIDVESNNFNSDNYTFYTWDDDANITVVGNTLEDIQACVDHAKDGYTIYLEGIEYNGTTEIHVDKCLTFIGKENTTLRSQGALNIFNISQDAFNITFKNIKFTQGRISFVGYNLNMINCTVDGDMIDPTGLIETKCSCIWVDNPDCNVTLLNSSFTNNAARWIFYLLNVNNLIVDNCIFANNTRWEPFDYYTDSMIRCERVVNLVINNSSFANNTYRSGNIWTRSLTNMNVTNCIFENNSGVYGTLYIFIVEDDFFDGTINIEHCDFISNKVAYISSNFHACVMIATYANSVVVNIKNCNFKDGSESIGLVHMYEDNNSTAYMSNCSFVNNSAEYEVIYSSCHVFKVDDCIFENNTGNVVKSASDVYDVTPFNSFENCSFKNNSGTCIDIYSKGNVSVLDCDFENSGIGINMISSDNSIIIMNCDFKGNSGRGINIDEKRHTVKNITIMECDFINNPGGGINIQHSDSTLITNCSFINNSVNGERTTYIDSATSGGAIFIASDNVKIMDCNFEKNSAGEDGGAICVIGGYENFTMRNCSFMYNSALWGGALYGSGTLHIDNCSFINNSVSSIKSQDGYGGALYVTGSNHVLANCNFINNTAYTNTNKPSHGGAAAFSGDNSIIANCSFINNSAFNRESALVLQGDNVTLANCTFENNRALSSDNITVSLKQYAAVSATIDNSNIINCSFINNSVISQQRGTLGAAITVYGINNKINYCEFINNSIKNNKNVGGAICAYSLIKQNACIEILNCAFVNNSVFSNEGAGGGAISINGLDSIIVNCSFENNSAYGGQKSPLFSEYHNVGGAAIYYDHYDSDRYHHTIINSTFKSNKEYGVYFNSVDNNVSIALGLEAYESLINAIYLNGGDLTLDFYNVTYWDNDEELNTDDVYPVASTLVKNQKIILEIYDSQGNLVDNVTERATGILVYDYIDLLPAGVYTYIAYHPDSEYYGYSQVSGTFEVGTPFNSLNEKIIHADNSINLIRDYVFDPDNDTAFVNGIVIDKNITIYGNGHSIDGANVARIFNVTDTGSLTLVNVTLTNAKGDEGAAIYNNGTVSIISSTVKNGNSTAKGVIYNLNTLEIINSTIADNHAEYGTIYNDQGEVTISESNITGNDAQMGAGVYNNNGNVTVSDSMFGENRADDGSAIWTTNGENVHLTDVRLVDNEGDALYSNDGVPIDTSGVKFLTAVSFRIADINDTLAGREITINVTELNKGKEFSGNVTVFIGDENYTVEIINGTGLKNVTPKWGLKTYTVRLTFNETDVYYSATAEGNPFHIRTNPTITIADIQSVDEGTQITVKVNAVDSFNRDLIVTIGGENYTVSMTNGSGERAITLAPGTYEATITFPESNCYTADNAKSNAFIVRANPRISIAEIANVIQGTPVTIKVTAVKSFNGELVIAINGANYTVSMTNGSGERTVTLAPGSYNATISFTGNDYYIASNAQSNGFTVSKESTSITASAVTVVYNTNKNLVITLKDSKGKPISGAKITINLNGAKTYTTDKNGQIKVPTKGLAAKTYTAKITFNGNANYIKSAKNVKVTVKKATPKLTAKNKKFKKAKKTKKYTITLKDNTGKAMKKVKVTLKIKGKKTFKAKTNNKGKATFKIKKLTKKGKYKATVTYKGDKNYNKATKKVKITIK